MKTVLALGTFDGVHIAHCKVLEFDFDCQKAVVTFKKPPKMFFDKNSELIMSYEDKLSVLKEMGFSRIEALDFKQVRDVEPLGFLEFLKQKFHPNIISCGFNYRFGKNGGGDTELLERFCAKNGIECRVCSPVMFEETPISSTLIRNLLKDGYVVAANRLLSKPFSFSAEVLNGDKRGRTIGFPTINQRYPEELVKVKFGVYKSKVSFDGKIFEGITNIGVRPTFESDFIVSETYIKDFSGDLYGRNVRITLCEFLRNEKKFASLEELKKQIEEDINHIK